MAKRKTEYDRVESGDVSGAGLATGEKLLVFWISVFWRILYVSYVREQGISNVYEDFEGEVGTRYLKPKVLVVLVVTTD